MACVGNGVGCVAGEAGTGAVLQPLQMFAAIVHLQPPQVILLLVPRVLTGDEGRCRHACNRFSDVAVVKATPLVGGSSGSATSPGGMS